MNKQTNRREFLGLGIAGAGSFALSSAFGSRVLHAAAFGSRRATGDDKILVVIQLSGGNDGLNTVIPVESREYRQNRRRLGIAGKDIVRCKDKRFGFHPSLKVFAQMLDAGQAAVIHGVGYPRPNRSHFKSMDIWQSADPTGRDLRFGWLGRALDVMVEQRGSDPDLAINLSDRVPLAVNGARYKPVSFVNPSLYRFQGAGDEEKVFARLSQAKSSEGNHDNPMLRMLRNTAREAHESSELVRRTAQKYRTPVRYQGSRLAGSLRTVASLIAGQLPTRVFYTYHNGFDTHVGQAFRHGSLLQQFDQAVSMFQRDLERLGVADRVAIIVFSEFGRRVRENQSQGTDHGVAAPMLVIGKRIRGGFYGEHPSLQDLDHGDLRHTVDFRRVYASVLDHWLRVDSKQVLRARFAPIDGLFARLA